MFIMSVLFSSSLSIIKISKAQTTSPILLLLGAVCFSWIKPDWASHNSSLAT
jgi:hypothetical protein